MESESRRIPLNSRQLNGKYVLNQEQQEEGGELIVLM